MGHFRGPTAAFLLSLLGACGGGGAGGSGDSAPRDFDLGLVAGAGPSDRVVQLVNPLAGPAQARPMASTPQLRFDVSSFPAAPVPAGSGFTCEITVVPVGPGEILGMLSVEFASAAETRVVAYSVRAEAEVVDVSATVALLDFGAPAYGTAADRTLTLVNRSRLSPVQYTSASFPTTDFAVVEPALPFTLGALQTKSVKVRLQPVRSIVPVNAAASLNPAGQVGTIPFSVRAAPAAGTAIVDFGERMFVNGLTEVFEVFVPAEAWALQVEAWRPGHLLPNLFTLPQAGVPDSTKELMSLALFEAPDGGRYNIVLPANGCTAALLPFSPSRAHNLWEGGGTYRFQFQVTDLPTSQVPVRVRAILKATPDGADPMVGALDLNLWIDRRTGLTAATAPGDPFLQGCLTQAGLIFQQVGIQIGDIDYYEYQEGADGEFVTDVIREASVREAMPKTPGVVLDRVNLFVGNYNGGNGGRTPGCAVAYSNCSEVGAGYTGNLTFLIVHEIAHHLGLRHINEMIMDVFPGAQPPNVMDTTVGQAGNTLSPMQGRVLRAHPFVR
jgi:hypothetical protein